MQICLLYLDRQVNRSNKTWVKRNSAIYLEIAAEKFKFLIKFRQMNISDCKVALMLKRVRKYQPPNYDIQCTCDKRGSEIN